MKRFYLVVFLLFQTLLFSQKKWDIKFYNEIIGREVFIYANNNEEIPMSAKFNFKLLNLNSTYINNEIIVIPEKSKNFLIAKLSPIKNNAANSFTYTSYTNFGNTLQENFDADYKYSLPFENGKTQLVFQGYNGKFSHQNDLALDFNLKIGDKILAAREGIVVEVVDNFNQNCTNLSCAKFNNKIIIMHNDGTFADYVHLKLKGAIVKKGDLVEKNQIIGYSGNTGFSSGPHLHFAVFINRIDGSRTYIKTYFKTSESDASYLEEGKNYTKNDEK